MDSFTHASSEIDQSEYGDVTGALMAEMLQGIKDSEYGGTTVNQWTGTAEIDDPKMKLGEKQYGSTVAIKHHPGWQIRLIEKPING